MLHEPLAADFVVPTKFPLLAVMVTPGIGARSSPRRKPLMVFWNCWFDDGDGVGEGVVACDAGATMSSSAATAANTAPTAFSSLPRRLGDGPLGVLLKIENLHIGGDVGCSFATAANGQGTRGGAVRCGKTDWPVMLVTLCGSCYSELGAKNAAASRENVAIG
jgi:hypothetical protein